jgi:hypothetical protein
MSTQIHADLTITVDDRYEIQVTGTGDDTLTVHLPSLRDAFSLWRRHREVFAPLMEQAAAPLDKLHVSLLFMVGGVPVALYDPSERPGLLARLAGIAPLSPKYRNIIGLLRNR